MSTSERKIHTSHADFAIAETSGSGLPVLLIHGNSSCKEVFRHQMEALGDKFRMIAIDLPGHGKSTDAVNPEMTYTMTGYANATVELLNALDIDRAVIFGWSLGGHVGMEMLPRFPGAVGLMIEAAPPVSPNAESIQGAFRPSPATGLVGKPDFTAEEAEMFALGTYGAAANAELRAAVKRTDGRARAIMFANLLGGGTADQRAIVEKTGVPVAVVNGADEPFVNTDYVGSISYGNLWNEHCYLLRGQGHAAFLTGPEAFNPILDQFLGDMKKRAAEPHSAETRKSRPAAA